MSVNPYQSPDDDSSRPQGSQPPESLWPQSRQRRNRMIARTTRAWFLFGLRALIFAGVIIALLILTRQR